MVEQVETAITYELKEIKVYPIYGMTKETQRRFWTDLAERVGAEATSLFNGEVYDTNPPQFGRTTWTLEGAMEAQEAWLRI